VAETFNLVLVRREDPGVVIVTLNRPDKRNALSVALIEQLRAAVEAASVDAGCRAIILRGAGPAFCAGLDLAEAAQPDGHERSGDALRQLYETLATSPAVTIAAAHGAAMGGGAGLVAACDFALAADDLRLAYPEVRRGLVAALVTCLLCRQACDRVVRELVLLGQTVDATRAAALGLVNRVVPAAQLESTAMELAREIARAAPGAIERTKSLLDELSARPIREDLERAMKYHLEARHSAEAAEGIAAFREKREPNWSRLRPG
jgi:methylglutaconyl-CoA hydratase